MPKGSADPSDAQLEDHVFADLAASFLSPEMFGDRPLDGDAQGGPPSGRRGGVTSLERSWRNLYHLVC
jgi:hypothetical protein